MSRLALIPHRFGPVGGVEGWRVGVVQFDMVIIRRQLVAMRGAGAPGVGDAYRGPVGVNV